MWLWYDWRAAAVANSDCNILDSEEWDGWHDTNAVCSRMDMIAHEALTPEAEKLLERFPEAKPLIHGHEELPDADWPMPSKEACLLYTSPSPRDLSTSRMPSSA